MCESTVFFDDGENREVLMSDVVKITKGEDSIICMDLTGETKEIKNAEISEVDSLKHQVVLRTK